MNESAVALNAKASITYDYLYREHNGNERTGERIIFRAAGGHNVEPWLFDLPVSVAREFIHETTARAVIQHDPARDILKWRWEFVIEPSADYLSTNPPGIPDDDTYWCTVMLDCSLIRQLSHSPIVPDAPKIARALRVTGNLGARKISPQGYLDEPMRFFFPTVLDNRTLQITDTDGNTLVEIEEFPTFLQQIHIVETFDRRLGIDRLLLSQSLVATGTLRMDRYYGNDKHLLALAYQSDYGSYPGDEIYPAWFDNITFVTRVIYHYEPVTKQMVWSWRRGHLWFEIRIAAVPLAQFIQRKFSRIPSELSHSIASFLTLNIEDTWTIRGRIALPKLTPENYISRLNELRSGGWWTGRTGPPLSVRIRSEEGVVVIVDHDSTFRIDGFPSPSDLEALASTEDGRLFAEMKAELIDQMQASSSSSSSSHGVPLPNEEPVEYGVLGIAGNNKRIWLKPMERQDHWTFRRHNLTGAIQVVSDLVYQLQYLNYPFDLMTFTTLRQCIDENNWQHRTKPEDLHHKCISGTSSIDFTFNYNTAHDYHSWSCVYYAAPSQPLWLIDGRRRRDLFPPFYEDPFVCDIRIDQVKLNLILHWNQEPQNTDKVDPRPVLEVWTRLSVNPPPRREPRLAFYHPTHLDFEAKTKIEWQKLRYDRDTKTLTIQDPRHHEACVEVFNFPTLPEIEQILREDEQTRYVPAIQYTQSGSPRFTLRGK
jgi:hypothetical protein